MIQCLKSVWNKSLAETSNYIEPLVVFWFLYSRCRKLSRGMHYSSFGKVGEDKSQVIQTGTCWLAVCWPVLRPSITWVVKGRSVSKCYRYAWRILRAPYSSVKCRRWNHYSVAGNAPLALAWVGLLLHWNVVFQQLEALCPCVNVCKTTDCVMGRKRL